jgi:hypothetical protein
MYSRVHPGMTRYTLNEENQEMIPSTTGAYISVQNDIIPPLLKIFFLLPQHIDFPPSQNIFPPSTTHRFLTPFMAFLP